MPHYTYCENALDKGTRLQRLSGRWRVYIPPFTKDAKDGAPVLFGGGERTRTTAVMPTEFIRPKDHSV
jgi:hypothetical protein